LRNKLHFSLYNACSKTYKSLRDSDSRTDFYAKYLRERLSDLEGRKTRWKSNHEKKIFKIAMASMANSKSYDL